MSQAKKVNTAINILAVVLVLVIGIHYFKSSSLEKDRLMEEEDIICLVAVCINEKGAGDRCFELNTELSLVSIIKDMKSVDGKRLIIEPSNRSCKI